MRSGSGGAKDIAPSREKLAATEAPCKKAPADHDATVAGRREESAAIAKEKKILEETSSGAALRNYQFMQTGSATVLRGCSVVAAVKQLAQKHQSACRRSGSRAAPP